MFLYSFFIIFLCSIICNPFQPNIWPCEQLGNCGYHQISLIKPYFKTKV